MKIQYKKYEDGLVLDGDYDELLADVQKRLAHMHFRQIIHKKRTIIVFEGWDSAGKGGIIRRMCVGWEPLYYQVYPIGAPTAEEKDRHFLWRFWKKLPGSRDIAIFDRSWYGRVLVERVEGFASEAAWRKGYDEINEFEARQTECDTKVIKIFLHITQDEQDKRFAKRLSKPEKRWKITHEDFRNRSKRDEYEKAIADMLELTDTRWAPWAVFDANDKKAARIAVMNHVANVMDDYLDDNLPDADPELLALAVDAFGYKAED